VNYVYDLKKSRSRIVLEWDFDSQNQNRIMRCLKSPTPTIQWLIYCLLLN